MSEILSAVHQQSQVWWHVLLTAPQVVEVALHPVERVMDTTGAGDAFLGGLIVGQYICITCACMSPHLQ